MCSDTEASDSLAPKTSRLGLPHSRQGRLVGELYSQWQSIWKRTVARATPGYTGVMASFTTLIRRPGAAPMFFAGLVGRLPMGMLGLAFTLLIVGQSGSYALAGAISATTTLSIALVAPYGSRLADRIGQTRAIPRLLAIHLTSYVLLTAAVVDQWPTALWFLFAAIGGASIPSVGAMVRARWVNISRNGAERSTAFAMESVADEASFMIGPILATALALAFFPAAAIFVALAASLIGGLFLATLRGTAPIPHPRTTTKGGHVLRFPGMWSMFLTMLAIGGVFGAMSVSTIAFAQGANPALTGVLVGSLSFGSLVSAVIIGNRNRTWSLTSQVRVAVITLAVTLSPLAFVTSAPVFAAVAFLSGLSVSAVMIGSFGLVERLVPNARLTEAMSIVVSGIALGIAFAISVSGVIIDAVGPSYSLGLASVLAATTAIIFWSQSRHLSELERAADSHEHVHA
jgi:MFS family permease